MSADARFEIKYVVSRDAAQRVLDAASSWMRFDAHAGPRGRYLVHSLYYDTLDFESCREVYDGQIAKTKFRLRRYNDGSRSFFEVKSRYNRSVGKTREEATHDAAAAFVADPFERPLPGPCGAFAGRLARNPRAAVVALSYDRIALEDLLGSDLRLTLDFDLRCGPPEMFLTGPNPESPRALAPGTAVLELKFSTKLPRWAARLTRELELTPRDCSKYLRSVQRWIGQEPPITEIDLHG